MILYHFCCERDMKGIKNRGITRGVIVGETLIRSPGTKGKWQPYFYPGWQWITLCGERESQSWATQHLIRYDRTEYRWTIDIPESEQSQIYDMDRLNAIIPGTEALFIGWPGSENWRVYRGSIPIWWLKKLDHWDRNKGQWETVWQARTKRE